MFYTPYELNTVEPRFSGLIGTASHSDMEKIRRIVFLFGNRLRWHFEVQKEISTNSRFRLHMYLRTNKILIHNSL